MAPLTITRHLAGDVAASGSEEREAWPADLQPVGSHGGAPTGDPACQLAGSVSS